MKKVLVTGANGQLGKTIRETVKDETNGLEFVFTSKEDLDITSKNKVNIFFANQAFDYCINCAAYTNVDQAEKTPEIAYKVNAEGVKNLAEICKQNKTILIHISTDYVFDGKKRTPYKVTDNTNPINVYGQSKLLGEKYIQEITKEYFIIRTSWLYSKQFGNNFYKTIVKKAQKEKVLYITASQTGCPTEAIYLAEFILKLIVLKKRNFGVLHFCGNKALTWYDFTKQILKENNLQKTTKIIKVENYITKTYRPAYSVLNTEQED